METESRSEIGTRIDPSAERPRAKKIYDYQRERERDPNAARAPRAPDQGASRSRERDHARAPRRWNHGIRRLHTLTIEVWESVPYDVRLANYAYLACALCTHVGLPKVAVDRSSRRRYGRFAHLSRPSSD